MKLDLETTLTERGQVSVPAAIREDLHLRPGQKIRWQKVSAKECRILIVDEVKKKAEGQSPLGMMIPHVKKKGLPLNSDALLKLLREGEK